MDVQTEARSLLEEFEQLTSSQRVARMVKLGAKSIQDENTEALLGHLASKTPYEQLLCLEACHGSRDLNFAKQVASSSPSKHLKKRAINLIVLYGSDEDLLWALEVVPPYLQVATLHRLRDARGSRKRLAVIEKYLERLEDEEENLKQFQNLFSLGSVELVERVLPKILDQFSNQQWLDLAKYHPGIAHRVLNEMIERSEEADNRVINRVNSILNQWLSHDYTVNNAVEVFRLALSKINIGQLPLTALMEKCPIKAVNIILGSDQTLIKDTIEELHWRSLRNLPMSSFMPLFERYPGIVEKYEFRLFRPKQRLLVYQKYREGWRNTDGTLDDDIVERLPTQERIAEARRNVKLRTFETKPAEKIGYIALLPWDEAVELQTPFIRSGDAQIRSSAIMIQIQAAKYDESHIEDALKFVLARKNEQDPFKTRMLEDLCEIPPGRWKESHLEIIDEIISSFLNSTDISIATLHGIMIILARILSVHPQWAAPHMGKLMRERDHVTFRLKLFGPTPVKNIMAHIQKELSPFLAQLLRKKDVPWIVNLEYLFHQYVTHWPEYLDTCEQTLLLPDVDTYMLSRLLDILKKYRPESWSRILPSVIHENTAIASEPNIVLHVHRRQQKLLDAYLKVDEEEPRARRNALQELRGGFWWWIPSQQAAFAQILLKDVDSADVSVEEKVKYVQQLSQLTFVDPQPLFELANSEESAIQEAALRSLGHLDSDQGLPVLIDALSDERARVAIYSLRNQMRTMSKSKTFALLSSIPQAKVTVSKETTRLIGELGTDQAYQYLLEKERADLHADVRVALYRALWTYLGRNETWEILKRAAEDLDPKIAKAVCSIPEDGLNPQRKQELLQVLLRLLSHESPEVRIAALKRCDEKPVEDSNNVLAPRLFELISSEFDDECQSAAKAIFEIYAKTNVEQIGEVFRKLLCDRKTLKRVHNAYMDIVSPFSGRKYLRPVTHLLLSIFKTDRLSVIRRVNLMFNGLPWEELRPYIFEIVPDLHADALHAAEVFIEKNGTGWKEHQDDLLKVELGMAGSKDERARRLALSFLIGGVDESTGWTDEERYRLEGYRNDSSALVAEAAWDFTIPEKVIEDSEGDEDVDFEEAGEEREEDKGEDMVMEGAD